jgi:glycosyltransferase involved in cell wall biosynthesis
MKVAIIRGANLNKFEMQTYEPLAKDFELLAFCLKNNHFDLSQLKISTKKLCGWEIFVPKFLRRFYDFFISFVLEINQPMFFLKKKLKGFDIVHSADASYYYSYQAAKAKEKYNFKLVLTQAENIPFLFGKNRWSKKRIQFVFQKVDLFLALSKRTKEALLLQGVEESKIKVVPFGVDTKTFCPQPKSQELLQALKLAPEDLLILYVGRLSFWKGIFELIYSAKKLVLDPELKNHNIKFLLVGKGRMEKKLKRTISFLHLEKNIQIVSGIPYEQIPQIHNLANIFVLPSLPHLRWQEQFGMVLIESMACAKPVVSTLSGAIPEVVGEAGILVQPNDHYSLYQALKKLILEENLRAALGNLARKRVIENFDNKVVAQKIKEIYHSLLRS